MSATAIVMMLLAQLALSHAQQIRGKQVARQLQNRHQMGEGQMAHIALAKAQRLNGISQPQQLAQR